MTLELSILGKTHDERESCLAAPLIRQAARDRAKWQEAAQAMAKNLCAESAHVLRLEAGSHDTATNSVAKLFALPAFLKRWRATHGESCAKEASCESRVRFEFIRADFDNDIDEFVRTFREQGQLAFAIETPENFFALMIQTPIGLEQAGDCTHLVGCIAELERAADMEKVVREAQQDMLLRVLDSGGTSAFVLNSEGWVRKQNECAVRLLGEILHFPGGAREDQSSQTASEQNAPDLKKLLPLERMRASQYSVTTPENRKLMIYAVRWRSNGSIFDNGDELLIAWDMRAEAPMLGTWQSDPNGRLAKSLHETFGLTRAESALVLKLVGSDLRTAATSCGMAYETARSHIKSVFVRMKISSQSELTVLVSRFAYHERLRAALLAA
jgi:hypothetical protein